MSGLCLHNRRVVTCLHLLLIAVHLTPGASLASNRYQFADFQMGTLFRIVLYAADERQAVGASRAAFARIEELDRVLSDYRPDSELNQVLQAVEAPLAVSPELFQLLDQAQEMSRKTGGAFDVTAGPLVGLWREGRRRGRIPAPDEIATARQRSGYRLLRLDAAARSVRLDRSGMRLDLGAVAKGYAADQALQVLAEHGLRRALIDAGGDVRLGEAPPGRPGWSVTLKTNNGDQTLLLANQAVATSGDDLQFLEVGGKRYSHILDPRSGWALTDHRLVTVIAPDALTADAWATALSVLEPEAGLKLVADLPHFAARIELRSKGETLTSPGWP